MASFSVEIIGRDVHDVEGAKLGEVADLRLAKATGLLTHLLVRHVPSVDPSKLPWPVEDGVVMVPIDMVERFATVVHLRR